MHIKLFYIVILLVYLCSCKNQDNSSLFILPSIVYEGEEVTVYAIKDSINIDSDSLFFHVDMFMQDMSYTKGYIAIIDGKAKFTVPKDAAFFMGYFYSVDDRDSVTYSRRIHNKSGKTVKNAYQLDMDKEGLDKELASHPNNLSAYSNYISHLAGEYSNGKISDTTFFEEANKYLKIVKQKANEESVSDLEALSTFYAYTKQYQQAQDVILNIFDKYPNSNYLNEAYSSYSFAYDFRDNKDEDDHFGDSLIQKIGKYYPQSPFGRSNMHGIYYGNIWIMKGYYKDEDVRANNNYIYINIDSTTNYFISANIEAYLNQKKYKKANQLANFILQEAKKGKWLHNAPESKKQKERNNLDINTSIANSYFSLANIEMAENNFEKALFYTDSSLFYYEKHKKYNYYSLGNNFYLNRKAYLQKKINQHTEALKTYETLYQETKDDVVLDSIKVLFKETEQEKGFESYAKNLKERVENKNQEPKKLAANFSIKDMSGYEIKLSDWKGRVVVLNFWANYCLPCAKEIPFLNKLWRETQTKDIIFLSVTKNTPLEVTRFAQRQKEMFSFSVLPNAKELADVYDVNLVPTTIVINKKGEIVHQESGFSGNIDKLKQVVLEELKK